MPYIASLCVAIAFEVTAVLLFIFVLTYRRTYKKPLVPFMHTLTRVAVLCAAYGLLFFFIAWPQVLSHIAVVWLLSCAIELLLYFGGIGRYAIYQQEAFSRAGSALLLPLISKIIGCAVLLGIVVHFFGF
jgi:hypothetical protein